MVRTIPTWACAGLLLGASGVSAQSGGAQSGLKFGENWLTTVRDSELVAKNFPAVEGVELLSPYFQDPESVNPGFVNGTDGPTDDFQLDFFIRKLAQRNAWLTYQAADFQSEEGRAIPYVYLSSPGSSSTRNDTAAAAAAAAGSKLRVYIQGGIHGNEPASDQSVLALLGKMDANQTWAASILDRMDIKILPRYNVDGVAYFQRQLSSNLDPNRDHIKLMKDQTRRIRQVISDFSPHIAIDMHEYTAPTIYGGHYQHGSDALISGGINLNIHGAIRSLVLDTFIPAMGARLEAHGLRWEHYVTGASNSTPGSEIVFTQAVTEPRTNRNAAGLTQAVSFLLETRGIRLADQHFQRRVATHLLKVEAVLELARDRAGEVYGQIERARADFIASDDPIVVTDSYTPAAGRRNFTMVDRRSGAVVQAPVRWVATTPSVPVLTRPRPEAYLIPRTWAAVAERLRVLGLRVETLDGEFRGRVDTLTVANSTLDRALYEGHVLNTVSTREGRREVVLPPGSFRVSTRQKNAALAFVALEPENIDSYVTFNIIPVSAGEEYPIFRIPRS
ncbi:hypothetical protein RB594_003974 [Gaeumannomyces avenae]